MPKTKTTKAKTNKNKTLAENTQPQSIYPSGKRHLDEVAFISWLMGPARNLNTVEIIEGFGRMCTIRGLPFHRIGLFKFSIQPLSRGSRYHWSIKTQHAEEITLPYSESDAESPPQVYLDSPMFRLFSGLDAFIHRPLYDDDCPMDFPILKDLKDEGCSDYLCYSLPHAKDASCSMVLSLASYQKGGFGGDEFWELLKQITPLLSIVLELANERNLTRVILDTYVGKRSGKLVMDGKIHKGDGDIIPAIIWFCDMRGFTSLNYEESQIDIVKTLNDFFGCIVESLDDAGGEVLKFMGDALLAIFPLPENRKHFASAVSETALAAAEEAKDKLAELNISRLEAGKRELGFGISLHVGDVMYGNIGGGSRLDFTVLGQAVNLASRIEGLNAELGRAILVSEEFRLLSKREFEHMGNFSLKGIVEEQPVYALKR